MECGAKDNVDGRTSCVRQDISSPRMSRHNILIAELLRPLQGSCWVRRVRKARGMRALLHQTAQNDCPWGIPPQASWASILGLPLSLQEKPLNLVLSVGGIIV